MASDLTLAGYGPHPERLTWRRFWYSWLHLRLRRERERLETRTFQLYLVGVQAGMSPERNSLPAMQAKIDEAYYDFLQRLAPNLPYSIRPLLGLPSVEDEVHAEQAQEAAVIEWWDDKIAEAREAGDSERYVAFLSAGRNVAFDQIKQKKRQQRPN